MSKNLIVMSDDHVSAFTSTIEARYHSHWMLQMFLGLDSPLDLNVNGNALTAAWVLVAANSQHRFSAKKSLHFTMLIESTSGFAESLKSKYLNNEYGFAILDNCRPDIVRQSCSDFLSYRNVESYVNLIQTICAQLDIKTKDKEYDSRVMDLLKRLDECDCSEHTVDVLAKEIYLSSSRLSHLFKDETGIPLKSYIVLHKLQKAYEILLEGKTSITNAAMMAGFDSPAHLAATNRSMMGLNARSVLKDSEFLKVSSFLRT